VALPAPAAKTTEAMKAEGGMARPTRTALAAVLVAVAVNLQGCESDLLAVFGIADIPKIDGMAVTLPHTFLKTHKTPFWRLKPDYWEAGSYKDPKTGKLAFNSCMNPTLGAQDVCNRRGTCFEFNPDSGLQFCKCDEGYGGSECEIKRLSQSTAWFLSLFFGPLGADKYYLGYIPEMMLKQLWTLVTIIGLSCMNHRMLWLVAFFVPWMHDVVVIGSGPAQGKQYLTTYDIPRASFVVFSMIWIGFIAMAFCIWEIKYTAEMKRLTSEQFKNYSAAKVVS